MLDERLCRPEPAVRSLLCVLLLLFAAANAMADDSSPGLAELKKCKICHTLDKGAGNRVGPNLYGVFGRKAGSADGFNYSEAMKQSGIVWDDDTLAKYLYEPRELVPGNKMAFPGIKDEAALQDLLRQLKLATQ